MQPLIRNLESLRRRTRLLLLVLRGSTWLGAVLAGWMVAAIADYGLRFPGWMRLSMLAVGGGIAAYYLVTRLGRAVRVNPTLPTLALRLESLYPAAAGRLASAVAFATDGAGLGESQITTQLAQRTTDDAQGVLHDLQVRRLVNPRPAMRAVAGLLIVLGLITGIAVGVPQTFKVGVERWANPLGDARWPNRFQVQSLTDRRVVPNNAPIPFAARVVKGDRDNLRTWVVYRFTREGATTGDWQRALMTRQADRGLYERPVEPQPKADGVQFYFEAGDDWTGTQSMELIQPPTLTAMTADLAPPPYAVGVLTADRHDLLQPPRPAVTVEALEGSRVNLHMAVEGSFTALAPEPDAQQLRDWLDATFIGFLQDIDATLYRDLDPSYKLSDPSAIVQPPKDRGGSVTFDLSFNLVHPARFRLRFTDAYGTRYDDQRVFVFEARPDRPPRAAVTVPKGDESVLPSAVVPVAAEGHDDVAIQSLAMTARPGSRPALDLAREEAREPRARVSAQLDLAPLKLKPGDEVALVAIARDNFKLADRVHDPVESPPRLLRIIAEQDLSRQLHADLADLRQRALRAQATQQQLTQAPVNTQAVQQQQDLSQRVEQMGQTVKQLQERVALNRLDDERLTRTLEESAKLITQAGKSSENAAGQLSAAAAKPQQADQPTEQARASQHQAEQKLDELAQLLDEGREAYELRQKLIKLSREQEAISEQVRQTLPKTLGRELDQLAEEQKRELSESAQKQAELSRQAAELAERMRSTAAAISRQSPDADQQAMAEALRQASQTATEQSLDQKMEQASKQVEQNQLGDARQSQDQAQQTLRQMLEQIDRAEQLKQQILRRKLAELVEAIRKLRDQQQAQIDRLLAAQKYDNLDAPMLTLRRNTLSVSETARGTDEKAAATADQLDKAAGHQAEAIRELRAATVDPTAAEGGERASLAALEEALKLAQELANKAQQQLTEDERRKLVEQYTKALDQQKAVHAQTRQLAETPEPDRNRRWRADSLKAGKQQDEVAAALTTLREKLGDTIVYSSVHDQVERWIERASGDLAAARPGRGTVFHQEMVIASIESLIEALGEDKPEDEQFAEGEQGGGGAGGQQGGPQPLIPPVAELKLLKARQLTVNGITRSLEQATEPDVQATILKEVAVQQESLADSGDKLLEKLQQQQPQVPNENPD